MGVSRDLHRFARVVGDYEAAARGPLVLATRLLFRVIYRAAFGFLNAVLKPLRRRR